jgi:hypothetical protein
MGSLRQSA